MSPRYRRLIPVLLLSAVLAIGVGYGWSTLFAPMTDASVEGPAQAEEPAVGARSLAQRYADLGAPTDLVALRAQPRPILPADHPLARLADPEAEPRVGPELERELPRLEQPEALAVATRLAADRDEDSTVRHEALGLLRRSGDPGLDQLLLAILVDDRERPLMRSYAAQHLAVNLEQDYRPETIDRRALLRRILAEDPQLEVRREALLGLARAGDETTLAAIRDGTSPLLAGMGDLVLAVWQEQGWRELAPLVPSWLEHEDEQAVVAAVALIASWKIETGRQDLTALDGRRGARVDRAVRLALRRLEDTP